MASEKMVLGALGSNALMKLNFQQIGYDTQYDCVSTSGSMPQNLLVGEFSNLQSEDIVADKSSTIVVSSSSSAAENGNSSSMRSVGSTGNNDAVVAISAAAATSSPDSTTMIHGYLSLDASQCFAAPFTLISCRCSHFDAFLPRLLSNSTPPRKNNKLSGSTKKREGSNDGQNTKQPSNGIPKLDTCFLDEPQRSDAIRHHGILDLYYPRLSSLQSATDRTTMTAQKERETNSKEDNKVLLEQRIKMEEQLIQQGKALASRGSNLFATTTSGGVAPAEGRNRRDTSKKRAKISSAAGEYKISSTASLLPNYSSVLPTSEKVVSSEARTSMAFLDRNNTNTEAWLHSGRTTTDMLLPPEMSAHVEPMLEIVRQNRDLYFKTSPTQNGRLHVRCRWCPRDDDDDYGGDGKQMNGNTTYAPPYSADDLIQCLHCGFVGCGPNNYCEASGSSCSSSCSSSLGKQQRHGHNSNMLFSNHEHIIRHFITSGHTFGITCGPRGNLYCFRCGDVVYHEIIDRISFSTEIYYKVPFLSWGKEDEPIKQVVEPSAFVITPEYRLFWPGMVVSYPTKAFPVLVDAARACLKRCRIFQGEIDRGSIQWGALASKLAVFQSQRPESERWKIQTPVGLYNLGNTCFMNCVLQCLLHCEPLQRHFLQRNGHHHVSCELLRNSAPSGTNNNRSSSENNSNKNNARHHCIACEMDRLFLETYGRVCGIDVLKAVSNDGPILAKKPSLGIPSGDTPPSSRPPIETNALASEHTFIPSENKGWPIIPSRLLTAAWKCGSMNHLAGYEQRDAHEFLLAFLDTMGKHEKDFYSRATFLSRTGSSVNEKKRLINTENGNNLDAFENIVKTVFEGCLRSVLICEVCGCRRSQTETFINVSLPIFKERDRSNLAFPIACSADQNRTISTVGTRTQSSKISLQMCLEQFTTPERLADSVHCHWCNAKTATQKQHTFAKLPKVLCLHLKRFDARANKKINDPVTFPINGLDMGPHLPHWREVLQPFTEKDTTNQYSKDMEAPSPQILYDLFGVINHTGTLHQGHYVAIVKVENRWYHCNDSFISYAGETIEESEVNSAYMLFYTRQDISPNCDDV